MKQQVIIIVLLALALLIALFTIQIFNNDDDYSSMHNSMKQMLVTSESQFIQKMIPHHQEAIKTAQQVLNHGATKPEIAELMKSIIEAQSAEVALMKEWNSKWFNSTYADTGKYIPMMRSLDGLTGVELDTVFLQDMIDHHMGAIMMSRSVQPYIIHDELSNLTQNIITTQSEEIEIMQNILETL